MPTKHSTEQATNVAAIEATITTTHWTADQSAHWTTLAATDIDSDNTTKQSP
jgi:hypothetical protein